MIVANLSDQSLAKALALELSKNRAGVFLRYDMARVAWQLCKSSPSDGTSPNVQRKPLDASAWNRLEKTLLESGVLREIPDLATRSAYGLIGSPLTDRHAILCSLDPFCYLSHLSAMEFHGLTDRMPEQLYITTPASTEWMAFAQERMAKHLGEDVKSYQESGLPLLRPITIDQLNQRPVHRYRSLHHGAFRSLKDSSVRVSTLGRTFLDMLRQPELCGGIVHVIECFEQHAARHRRLIFDELDQHGADIDKVRAGFILETVCQIQDPRIDAWLQATARGGSRKLDAGADYAPVFSERWALSINVPHLQDRS